MSESTEAPVAPMLSDGEVIALHVQAIRTFTIYSQTALFFALIERRLIDPERFFTFARMNAAILRQAAATTEGGKVSFEGLSMAAGMLEEFEAVIRNMATKPPGAGTA